MNIRRFFGIVVTALLILSLPGCLYGAVVEKEFFSVELPADWKISEENGNRYISFSSPVRGSYAALLSITTYKISNLSSEKFLDMNLEAIKNEGINIGIPKKN
ncbi:MAG: hypothetical protein LBU26_00555 [Synergistaceae bacterium]|jgi:hypothetical protein|nr:hypothetical protein [Synergistaceae bacterium]